MPEIQTPLPYLAKSKGASHALANQEIHILIPAATLAMVLYFLNGDSAMIIIIWVAMEPSAWTVVTSWKADSWEHSIR